QQYAPPLEVYRKPANTFTADFVGSPNINLVEGVVTSAHPTVIRISEQVSLQFSATSPISMTEGQAVTLGLRPEHITIADDAEAMAQAEIISSLPSGMETIIALEMDGKKLHSVVFGDLDFEVGKQVGLSFAHGLFNLFDQKSGNNLGQGTLSKA
ncbi:MAG: TOBE domain-containing protein, partial [Spirochaetales bacterium]|nr:TOBE domain-containing protein [Spirochaetales bacterium]